jgi:hypothetical protein
MRATRKEFIKTLGFASASFVSGNAIASTVNSTSYETNANAFPTTRMKQNADKIKLGVSLYSYQHAIYTGEMTTEDCLAEINAIGAEGVQIIDGITIPNFPNPPEYWVEQWFGWLDKYKLTPTLMDTFVDVYKGYRRPAMDIQEQLKTLINQCKLAKRLGYKIIRPISADLSSAVDEVFKEIVPFAEDLNVKIAPEIHSPTPLKGPFVDSIMEIITKTGTKHIGFTYDFGDIGYRYYSPIAREEFIRQGIITRDIALYVEQANENGESLNKVQSRVKRMNPKPGDLIYMNLVNDKIPPEASQDPFTLMNKGSHYVMMASMIMTGGGVPRKKPQELKPLIPYIFNCHGKFYQMSEDFIETQIEYPETIKVLIESGWEGSIDSEYEGQRHLQNQWCEPINEVEEVRRHHVMLRRLLYKA